MSKFNLELLVSFILRLCVRVCLVVRSETHSHQQTTRKNTAIRINLWHRPAGWLACWLAALHIIDYTRELVREGPSTVDEVRPQFNWLYRSGMLFWIFYKFGGGSLRATDCPDSCRYVWLEEEPIQRFHGLRQSTRQSSEIESQSLPITIHALIIETDISVAVIWNCFRTV